MALKKAQTVVCGLLVMFLLVAYIPVQADTFFKQISHTDPVTMMGQTQPAQNDTVSVWIGENKGYMNTGDNRAFLLLADEGKMYFIDYEKKNYAELPVDFLAGKDAEKAEAIQGMAMMGNVEATVTPTEETKKIGDWNATKYNLEIKMGMGQSKGEIWASEDLKINTDLYVTLSQAILSQMPGFTDMLEQMRQIKGVQVESSHEMNMMGAVIKTSTELLEFAEKDAPAGTYVLPEGFKETDFMQMGQ